MKNKVVVNADDFGLIQSYTDAIIQAFEENCITSTTACANGDDIVRAVQIAKEKGLIDKIGVHINFTEGTPLTKEITDDPFFCEDGVYHSHVNRLKKLTKAQKQAVYNETVAQIERLRALGVPIRHADSHHHIHTAIFFAKTIKKAISDCGIEKIRLHRNAGNIPLYKKIVKNAYNKKLKKQGFLTADYFGGMGDYFLKKETFEKGVCEIMVHPDYDKNGVLVDRVDVQEGFAVGQPLQKIKELTAGKTLISYSELK